MSKVAEAQAEARRLHDVDGLDVSEIAARMGRSEEGARLLLEYAGVVIGVRPEPVIVEEPAPVLAETARPADDSVRHRVGGARKRLHTAMLASADADGLVVLSRAALAEKAGICTGGWSTMIDALKGADLIEVARRGQGDCPAIYRVFESPTAAEDRPPLPPVPALPPRAPRARQPTTPRPAAARQARSSQPVNTRIVGWCQAYLARGVKLSYLAELFEIDPRDLAAAVPA